MSTSPYFESLRDLDALGEYERSAVVRIRTLLERLAPEGVEPSETSAGHAVVWEDPERGTEDRGLVLTIPHADESKTALTVTFLGDFFAWIDLESPQGSLDIWDGDHPEYDGWEEAFPVLELLLGQRCEIHAEWREESGRAWGIGRLRTWTTSAFDLYVLGEAGRELVAHGGGGHCAVLPMWLRDNEPTVGPAAVVHRVSFVDRAAG